MAKLELTQAELDTKIGEAVTAAVTKLQGKNTELQGELKTARKTAKAFEGYDPDQVKTALENAKASETKALADKGEYEKALNLAKEQHKTQVADLTTKLEAAQGGEKKLRTELAIDKAMDKINVAPHFREAVRAMKANEISIIDKDGKPTAMVGDLSVNDALKTWAESDEGKHYVGDSGAGGGGASGGKGGGGQVNPWATDTRNLSQQGILERDNPSKAAQLKREAGVEA